MVKDSLSALLDGECSAKELDQLLDELDRSPELAQQWSRLCLAREAAEGTRVAADQPCICSGVMSQLDDQPAHPTKVVELAARRRARFPVQFPRIAAYWKPAVGFAAAASMGAAAVLLVQPAAERTLPGVDANGFTSGQLAGWVPAGSSELALQPVASLDRDDAHAEMLQQYLMDHSNAIAGDGVGGTLRYARFAAHTAEYQPQADEAEAP